MKRAIAGLEVLLVLPGAMFMAALFVRNIQPVRYEPARSAQRLVDWFAARPGLDLDCFLVALPFAAFLLGASLLFRQWRTDDELRKSTAGILTAARTQVPALLTAGATLVAGAILGIVALHVITD